ncbi:MAG TPA: hypothetical protein VF956_08645 [Candidatus Dormibacteraeota bacterium]
MRILGRVLVTAITVLGLIGVSTAPAFADEKGNLTDFSSMTAIPVGGQVVRGITGGGLPWKITSGTGTVSQQGVVDVTVTGLVLKGSGVNPIPSFEATVSCVTPHGVVNVMTGGFPASSTGDSHITATVDLPRPCKDPIVFVGVSPAGRWFAMSNPDSQP